MSETYFIDPGHLAQALGGEARGATVIAPGPNNIDRRNDRSMEVLVDPHAPDGFVVRSYSGKNTWQECRDYVRRHAGLSEWKPTTVHSDAPKPKPKVVCHYEYQDEAGEPYLRVTRMSDKSFRQSHWDIDGWANGKPSGAVVPYRLPDLIARPNEKIWLVEGEKDADNLAALGLLATTAPGGGGNFPLTPDFGRWFDGREVVAIADNDATGARWRDRVSQAVADVVHISMPAPHKDVSDWLQAGGTLDELHDLVTYRSEHEPITADAPHTRITPTAFVWTDPSTIPPREWVYDTHLIRKFVSLTVSPGGLGKSSLALVEALSMVTNRPLLDDAVIHEKNLKVWYWNGEDPQDETRRRVMAACKHYGISADDLGGRLFTDSGRDKPLILGQIDKGGIVLNEDLFAEIEQTMLDHGIDVFMADPFVSAHRLGENDNNAIDALIKRLGKLADRTNAAIEIVHHVRKPNSTQAETDVNDARGASALIGGVRSARVLNVMSEDIRADAGVSADVVKRYFSVSDGKANMSPRAAESRWRYLESVNLDNETADRKSDNVGVVTFYELPKAARLSADLSGAEDEMRLILSTDDMVRHWSGKGRGPKPKNWLGHRILESLKIHDGDHDAAMQRLITGWIKDGTIVTRSAWVEKNRIICLTLPGASFEAYPLSETPSDVPF